jgi:CRP/FNR family transcriptional regulator, cyclic AMP receptor protein
MSPSEKEPRNKSQAAFSDLRVFRIFQHAPDEQLGQLASFASEVILSRDQVVYQEGEFGEDFFVVLAGTVEEFSTTLGGRQAVSRVRVGQLLGETSFLDARPRPTTAIATDQGALLRFDSAAVKNVLHTNHEMGAVLARSFWYSLASKIRQANEFMTQVVPVEHIPPRLKGRVGEKVDLKPGAKVDLFQQTGLSAAELRLLAVTLQAQHFAPDTYVFQEGEVGDALYIVFDGEVRISRRISGRGEEPITVLGRGEVFGEMAIVDEQPRSADARAHGDGCTVLVLSQNDLDAVLHMPPAAASQFLYLVCGVLCHRLRTAISLLDSLRTG